jgi:hypothetical protein
MEFSKSNPELEAKLAALSPGERLKVEAVALRMAKHRLRKMLDKCASKHWARRGLIPSQVDGPAP